MQQTDKHGPVRDDALKHEVEGLVRNGRATDADEWAEPEPSSDDQPVPTRAPLMGGTPPGMTPREVEERSLLGRYLGSSVYPATTDDLVAKLRAASAPDRFIKRIGTLPQNKNFGTVREVAEELGIHVESQRY